jgi:hypothetical protein
MPKRTVAKPRSTPAIARVAHGGASIFLDSILRGRAWVAVIGVLLAGIVFLNVRALELNRGIAENAAKTERLERVNSKMRGRVGRLDSAERIQQLAEQRGFVLPQPGDVTYLKPRRAHDAKLAVTRMTEPEGEATTLPATTETVAPTTTTPPPPETVVTEPTAVTTPAPTPTDTITTTVAPTTP